MTDTHDPRLEFNTDLPEWAEYVGGDIAPADLWGIAPERGRAIEIVEKALGNGGFAAVAALAVDALIEAEMLPDETRKDRFQVQNLGRAELIRRCTALYDEAYQVSQILAGAVGIPKGDGRYWPADEYMVVEDTPVTLAEKAAKRIADLRAAKRIT